MAIRMKLDKRSHLSLNKSIKSIKAIFKKPCQVNTSSSSSSSSSTHFFVSGGIPATRISVSSFDSPIIERNANSSLSQEQFLADLNDQATNRAYLAEIQFNQTIKTLKGLETQASSLRQLTDATNQLTRHVIVRRFLLLLLLLVDRQACF